MRDLTIEELFEGLEKDTQYLSSTSQMEASPYYKELINRGKSVLPFIVRNMKNDFCGWPNFLLATDITGIHDNITDEASGYYDKVKQIWLNELKEYDDSL